MERQRYDSPLGPLTLVAEGEALVGIYLPASKQTVPPASEATTPALDAAAAQLGEYFAGRRRAFDLPLAPKGTDFQKRVWAALREIPFATTVSYGELAVRLGGAEAVRAVGAANGKNPFAIVVPCHRVVAASGELVGYAGGLSAKRWLLTHEARVATSHGEARGQLGLFRE